MNVSCHVWTSNEILCALPLILDDPLHLQTSSHIWMCHVTYECVTSRMNVSCHVRMRELPLVLDYLLYLHESCHMLTSHVTCECVMSRINVSRHVWMRDEVLRELPFVLDDGSLGCVGLFYVCIGLFWGCKGLFSVCMGFFWVHMGSIECTGLFWGCHSSPESAYKYEYRYEYEYDQ